MDPCCIFSLSDAQLREFLKDARGKNKQKNPTESTSRGPTTCLVEGCGKRVVWLYNHITKYHGRHGMSGEFTMQNCVDCIYLYCSLQILR